MSLAPRLKAEEKSAGLPSVDFVAAGIDHFLQEFKEGTATVVARLVIPDELASYFDSLSKGGVKNGATNTVKWYYHEPNLCLTWQSQESSSPEHDLVTQSRVVITADEYRLLQAQTEKKEGKQETYYSGGIAPADQFLSSGLFTNLMDMDPRYYAYYWEEKPLSEVFRSEESQARVAAEETVFDSRCLRVDLSDESHKASYWVDIEHNFLVRRMQAHYQMFGSLVPMVEAEVPELQHSGNVWLPAVVERRLNIYGKEEGVPDQEAKPILFGTVTTRTEIRDFRADAPVPDEVFILHFPRGTRISDHFTQKVYHVVWEEEGEPETSETEPGKEKPAEPDDRETDGSGKDQ